VLYEAAQKPHSERPPVLSTYPCIAEAMERLGGPSVWLCLTEAALNLENGGDVAEVLDVMHGGFPHSVETVANGDPESTVRHFIFALRKRLRNETIDAQTRAHADELKAYVESRREGADGRSETRDQVIDALLDRIGPVPPNERRKDA
jgi:hypothetical protein